MIDSKNAYLFVVNALHIVCFTPHIKAFKLIAIDLIHVIAMYKPAIFESIS